MPSYGLPTHLLQETEDNKGHGALQIGTDKWEFSYETNKQIMKLYVYSAIGGNMDLNAGCDVSLIFLVATFNPQELPYGNSL